MSWAVSFSESPNDPVGIPCADRDTDYELIPAQSPDVAGRRGRNLQPAGDLR